MIRSRPARRSWQVIDSLSPSAAAVAVVTAGHPMATVTVWADAAHRLGLLPVVRRVWAPQGQRPTASVARHYAWLSVYGFVRPTTGQSWWCLLPRVTAAAMALATFTGDEGIDTTHRAVLVGDQTGWHISPDLVLPPGIDLVLLPSFSPELQHAERLWPLVDEPLDNRALADLDTLEVLLVECCRILEADRDRLKAHTLYPWWPPEPSPDILQ